MLTELPKANYELLYVLCIHLNVVQSNSAKNLMHAQNLALIFAPIVIRDQSHDEISSSSNPFGLLSALTESAGTSTAMCYLIKEAPTLFTSLDENVSDIGNLVELIKDHSASTNPSSDSESSSVGAPSPGRNPNLSAEDPSNRRLSKLVNSLKQANNTNNKKKLPINPNNPNNSNNSNNPNNPNNPNNSNNPNNPNQRNCLTLRNSPLLSLQRFTLTIQRREIALLFFQSERRDCSIKPNIQKLTPLSFVLFLQLFNEGAEFSCSWSVFGIYFSAKANNVIDWRNLGHFGENST